MDSLVLSVLFALIFLRLTAPIAISFNGETLIKRYDKLHLNCSTDTVPVGYAADIKVNEKSYTIITLSNGECFSTILGQKCTPDICECSTNGLWFTHVYHTNEPEGMIELTCSMIFGPQGTVSDNFQVRIIDFTGPIISTNSTFPLLTGSEVQFFCKVETKVKIVTFQWTCLEKTMRDQVKGFKEHISKVMQKVHLRHDNQMCDCSANVDGIVKPTSIQIKISKNPTLQINESVTCSSFSPVILYCSITTELNLFGFNTWKHYYRGSFVRTMRGIINKKQSSLSFESCNYQDAGEYECIGWTEHSGATFYANETVNLSVYHSPLIISANVHKETNVKLAVTYFSPINITATWLRKEKLIMNSTKMIQTSESTPVHLTFYNQTIDFDGCVASLLLSEDILAGEYVLVLKNNFGETRQSLYVDSSFASGTSFDFRTVIIGITAMSIFILTATCTAIISGGRQCHMIHIVGPNERSPTIPVYHSAPGCDSNYHTYEGINAAYLDAIDNTNEEHYSEVEYNEPNADIRQHHYYDVDYNESDADIRHHHYEEVS